MNFWKVNPALAVLEPFKTQYKKEGAKGSALMWFVVMVADPESPLRNLPEADRIRTLLDNKMITENEYNVKLATIKQLIEAYTKLNETPAMRQLRIWNQKMNEKSALMERLEYSENTFEVLEKMMMSNTKIYSELELISKKIAAEEDTITKGGGQESLTDKGLI